MILSMAAFATKTRVSRKSSGTIAIPSLQEPSTKKTTEGRQLPNQRRYVPSLSDLREMAVDAKEKLPASGITISGITADDF